MHFFPNNQNFRTCSSEYANLRWKSVSVGLAAEIAQLPSNTHSGNRIDRAATVFLYLFLIAVIQSWNFPPRQPEFYSFAENLIEMTANPTGHRVAFSEIVPCFDPCVCVLGIFAVIFPTIQLLLTNIYFSVRAYAGYHTLKLVKAKEETSPRPKVGPHVVVAMLIFFYSIYVSFYLLFIP